MRPFKWSEIKTLAEARGFRFERHRGSHYIMVKEGALRAVVIPMRNDLKEDIVKSVARTIGMSHSELVEYTRQSAKSRKRRNG